MTTTIANSGNGFFYLTPEAQEQLPEYKYRGRDNSLLYNYILSPLATWCVDKFVPRAMAPNTVTLIGLVLTAISYVIYWFYVPDLIVTQEQEPPRWIFLFNVIAMLVYQTLDNMDGKQARRTNSSSPLGLMFDHGCDTINCIFTAVNYTICVGMNPVDDFDAWIYLIFGAMFLFYTSSWEQYATGEFSLPIVNGPNEGLIITSAISFASFLYGPFFWHGTEMYEMLQSQLPSLTLPLLRNCDVVTIGMMILPVFDILFKCVPVCSKYPGSAMNLVPILTLSLCNWAIGRMAPELWANLPRTAVNLATALFTDMCTDLMLAHVVEQKFTAIRWQMMPLVGLSLWLMVFGYSSCSTTIDYILMAYTYGAGAYVSMKIVLLTHEVCSVLGIWCFDIVSPHPNRVSFANGNGHAKHD